MNDINKMRLGVLRELKNVHKFLDNMERSVKTRNPEAIQRAYMFLVHLVREMNEGCLTPDNVALDVQIAQLLQEVSEQKPRDFTPILAHEIPFSYDANFLSENTLRFYVDGYELDVQDPTFFMDEEEYTEIKQTLDEMLSTYADLPMAKPR